MQKPAIAILLLLAAASAARPAWSQDHWSRSRGPCYSSPVAGDGKIYTCSARGRVTVLRAGDQLEILARNDLGDRIMATPALVEGTIYLRTERTLCAFQEPQGE